MSVEMKGLVFMEGQEELLGQRHLYHETDI